MNPKAAQLSALAAMVLIMTGVVVFVSTWINFGLDEAFVLRFLKGWGLAFLIAYPLVLILMPRLQKFFQGFVKKG